tara:strand:- start:3721 stop:4116 length:396 start_codon:yes stop_codon:yes gene_type:complete
MNRTITFTPRELEMIMTALDTHTHSLMSGCLPTAEQADEINEFNELRDDLLAESSGHHDGWGDPPASCEDEMFNAGVEARELMKRRNRERARAAEAFGEFEIRTGSLAQVRRVAGLKRMMQGTATAVVEED